MSALSILALTVLSVHLVLGVLCLAVARGDGRMKAVQYWGWGMLVYAGGLLLAIPSSWLSRATALTLADSAIAYAPIPFIQGVLSHADRRLNMRWAGAALALVVGIICWNNQFGPQFRPINMGAPTFIATALFLYGGVILLRHPVPAARKASILLAIMLIFCALHWIVRIILLWEAASDDNQMQRAELIIELFGIVQILISVTGMLCLFWIEVLKMEHTLISMAYGDPLTGLANRRATMTRFEEALSMARRLHQPLALAVFDIDFFKKVNDTQGHQVGDEVLKRVSSRLVSAKRHEDLLGRIGGEEFVLLLPNTDIADGRIIAERMRELVAGSPVQTETTEIAVTISGGLAAFPRDGDNWDRIFAAADERLYRSKNNGRNRITAG